MYLRRQCNVTFTLSSQVAKALLLPVCRPQIRNLRHYNSLTDRHLEAVGLEQDLRCWIREKENRTRFVTRSGQSCNRYEDDKQIPSLRRCFMFNLDVIYRAQNCRADPGEDTLRWGVLTSARIDV